MLLLDADMPQKSQFVKNNVISAKCNKIRYGYIGKPLQM